MANNDVKPARTAKTAVETLNRAANAAADSAQSAAQSTADATATATEATASAARSVADAAFDYPRFEVPEMVRSFAEQGLNQSREAYGRMRAATEEATDVMQQSFETTRDSVRDVQLKTLDVAKANFDASFDLARRLLTVTSVADAIQLQSTFARERFEALVDYSKDVQSSLTKVGTEATRPARVMLDRAVNQSKAA